MARRRRLHRRDLAIFETLLERRAETLGFLAEAYFSANRETTARNRLGELRSAGYLDRTKVDAIDRPGAQNVYTLTAKGRAALRLRALAGEALRESRGRGTVPAGSLPHQIATNRVGDWLGARLIPDHQLAVGGERRHRPDAAYQASADELGRSLVFLEVDLGHYSRARVLAKIASFLDHEQARSILFVTTTDERRATIAGWIRAAYGEDVMQRVQPLTLEQVRRGSLRLDPGTEPREQPRLADAGTLRDWVGKG